MPICLPDHEIQLNARQAAADHIYDPLGHRRQREAPVETEAVPTEVKPGVLFTFKSVKAAAEGCLEVAQQRVDPAELRQVIGMPPAGDDGLMAAPCRGDRAEAGQTIREHGTVGNQASPGPGADRI